MQHEDLETGDLQEDVDREQEEGGRHRPARKMCLL